ncbi:hypothetical protein LTR10_015962 [Elasticomyces elasticus]|nr:hypothetical protein LTR10_015962 [Elasticomyces elasticus]KAK4974585.1 hypothetical protein LTR42_005230 [Elasticomyces elasticus]
MGTFHDRYDDAFLTTLKPGHRNSILRRRRNHELHRKGATAGDAEARRNRELSSEFTAMEADANDRGVQPQRRRSSIIEVRDSNKDYTSERIPVETEKHFKLRPLVRRDHVDANANEDEHPAHTHNLEAQLSRTQHEPLLVRQATALGEHMTVKDGIAAKPQYVTQEPSTSADHIIDLCHSDDETPPVMKAKTFHEQRVISASRTPSLAVYRSGVHKSASQAVAGGTSNTPVTLKKQKELRLRIQAREFARIEAKASKEKAELEEELLHLEAEQ